MNPALIDRRQLLIAGAAMLAAGTIARGAEGTVRVTIEKMAFVPADISVRAGQTIEWTNKDPVAHTATVKGGWEVLIPPGKSATRVVTAADGVDYYCRFHPNMKGRITIVG